MYIKKYVTAGGVTIEVGDFYGGGPDEVVTFMEEQNRALTVTTSSGQYTLTITAGDYMVDTEGSGHIVKSKFDREADGIL